MWTNPPNEAKLSAVNNLAYKSLALTILNSNYKISLLFTIKSCIICWAIPLY